MTLSREQQIELDKLLPRFCQKFFPRWPMSKGMWGRQIKDATDNKVLFTTVKDDKLTEADLVDHFGRRVSRGYYPKLIGKHPNGKPKYEKTPCSYGSLATYLARQEGNKYIAKSSCIDIDGDGEYTEIVRTQLLPLFDKYGWEYIWETAGDKGQRAHFWFFHEATTTDILARFMEFLFKDAGLTWPHVSDIELYPAKKPTNLIRIALGVHLKANRTFPVTFRGKTSKNPLFFVKAVIACKTITQAQIIQFIADKAPVLVSGHDPENVFDKKIRHRRRRQDLFHYKPRNLDHNLRDEAPPFFDHMLRNCQAINKMQHKIEDEMLLDDRGGDIHKAGLFMSRLFQYEEARVAQTPQEQIEVQNFAEWYFEKYRFRDYADHNWHIKPSDDQIIRNFAGCKKWHEEFNMCDGCPWKNREDFTSPRQLWGINNAIAIKTKRVGSINVVAADNETIYQHMKEDADAIINESLANGTELLYTIATPRGTKKSTYIANVAADLVRNGYSVLIITKTGKLAKEQWQRLRQKNVKTFIVGSHNNLFTNFNDSLTAGIRCDFANEIKELQELGAGRREIRRSCCEQCPFYDECPFPDQYQNVQDTKAEVVIIQHAHMKIDASMRLVLRKGFDIIFIDETFVNECYDLLKVQEDELALIRSKVSRYPWLANIQNWLSGKVQKEHIEPELEELARLKKIYARNKVKWNLPVLVKAYNEHKEYDPKYGLFQFFPPPEHPRIVLADATAPKQVLEIIFNKKLKVDGRYWVVDPTLYNPKNQTIKVLDRNSSVNSWTNNEPRLERWLRFIGTQASGPWRNYKILVTTYSSLKKKVEKYFDTYFLPVRSRIIVSHMKPGTNEFADCNVQVQLAGRYSSAEEVLWTAWKLRNIVNYWAERDGKEQIINHTPVYGASGTGAFLSYLPVRLKLQQKGKPASVYEIPDIKIKTPGDLYESLAFFMNFGVTEQANRLRYIDDQPRIQITVDKGYLPGVLYTDWELEDEFLSKHGIYPQDTLLKSFEESKDEEKGEVAY
jgi:hypothetical protein